MQEIKSSVDIDASAAMVWAILTDFASYRRWNPFIRAIAGKPAARSRLTLTLQCQGRQPLSTRCTLTRVREPRELSWRRHRIVPAFLSSEHRFRIESLAAGGVRFHHSEQINGLLASLLGRGWLRATEQDFHAMNHALKTRAERVEANLADAGQKTS
ncbi:MAG: SRPBCC domain-containing protein [Hyphomicrobium sp.]|jgi:hypothetical protein|nr:SRPBCC domain-containing protein [Hyphomicrobium sp.]